MHRPETLGEQGSHQVSLDWPPHARSQGVSTSPAGPKVVQVTETCGQGPAVSATSLRNCVRAGAAGWQPPQAPPSHSLMCLLGGRGLPWRTGLPALSEGGRGRAQLRWGAVGSLVLRSLFSQGQSQPPTCPSPAASDATSPSRPGPASAWPSPEAGLCPRLPPATRAPPPGCLPSAAGFLWNVRSSGAGGGGPISCADAPRHPDHVLGANEPDAWPLVETRSSSPADVPCAAEPWAGVSCPRLAEGGARGGRGTGGAGPHLDGPLQLGLAVAQPQHSDDGQGHAEPVEEAEEVDDGEDVSGEGVQQGHHALQAEHGL